MQQLKNNCHHQNHILILNLYPSKEAHVGAGIDIQRNFFGLRNFDGEGDDKSEEEEGDIGTGRTSSNGNAAAGMEVVL